MDRTKTPDADQDFSTARRRTIAQTRSHLRRLLQPGLLGVYSQVAVYEIFAITPRSSSPANLPSVAVLEEGDLGDTGKSKEYLTPGLIQVKGLKAWKFGVAMKRQPVDRLDAVLAAVEDGQPWTLSGDPLDVGTLEALAPFFAPPDGVEDIPVNRMLRNNFWSGSHVIRLSHQDEARFKPFLDDRRLLQRLSDQLRDFYR